MYTHMYMHTYIHTYMHTYLRIYIHTYMHACIIHTYIHTHIHTYIHAYILLLYSSTCTFARRCSHSLFTASTRKVRFLSIFSRGRARPESSAPASPISRRYSRASCTLASASVNSAWPWGQPFRAASWRAASASSSTSQAFFEFAACSSAARSFSLTSAISESLS